MYPGKPTVLWFKRRTWPIAKIVAVICAAFWAGAQYEKGWRVTVIAPPSHGLTDDQLFPPSKPLDFSDLIPVACKQPPQNGAPLTANWVADLHNTIVITNGSGSNAIVKARDAATGGLIVSLFVAARSTANYRFLPYGSYWFQFVFGDDLDSSCKNFLKPRSAQRFPRAHEFEAGYESEEDITLTPVPGGNVQTESIDMAAFNAP